MDEFKAVHEKSEEERKKAAEAISLLVSKGFVLVGYFPNNAGAFQYDIKFPFSDGVDMFLNIGLFDHQSGADLLIASIVMQPDIKRHEGYGSKVITLIKEWAKLCEFKKIIATQVSNPISMNFWKKSGFKKVEDSDTGDYVLQL